MKKILFMFFACILLISPLVSHADVDQNKIQKELVIARHDVTTFYGPEIHDKLDLYFIKLLHKKDKNKLNKIAEVTWEYIKWKESDWLNKKEILIRYLFVRSYYEANFRLK